MTGNDQKHAEQLAEKLEIVSHLLKDDQEKELLTGILTVAHGLEDGTVKNGNGASAPGLKVANAFAPLPDHKIQKIMNFARGDGSSISYHPTKDDPNPSTDDPNKTNDDSNPSDDPNNKR